MTRAGERQLTELEGAVLTEVALRGNDTAYKVRQAFQLSPSVQWRGSSGAVSPAIRRLLAGGLLVAEPHPSRAGQILSVSPAGTSALRAWASDIDLACSIGLDPFRLRSGIWETFPEATRGKIYRALSEVLENELASLRETGTSDIIDRHQTALACELIEGRIKWLRSRQRASQAK